MNSKIFFSIIFGFLAGVFLSSIFTLGVSIIVFAAMLAVLFLVFAVGGFASKKVFLLISIFLIGVSAGVARFYVKDSTEPRHELDNFLDQNVTIEGVIKDEVDTRESSQRVLLSADSITFDGNSYAIRQQILVSADLFPKYQYGEKIKATGKLKTPENFLTDIGKEFDYVDYLRKDSIYYTMSFGQIDILEKGQANTIKAGILFVKKKFLMSIENSIPSPESALLGGLLLGTKQSLGQSLQQDFVNTGLVHIIVLSGYNVTIIAEALIKMLSLISISVGIYFGGLAIILFVIMTGAGATIVRAGIMAILALVARATGRSYDVIRALMLAAAFMVLQNPYVLFFDISFQLSFMATLGLMFMSPISKRWFWFLPEKFGLREIVSATIGVQVFVLPFILYKMGNLSLVAPITNTLVLPLIPMTMFFGFVAGALSFASRIIALPFGWISYLLLHWEIGVVQTCSHLSFSTIKLAHFPLVIVIMFYGWMSWYLIRYYQKHRVAGYEQ